MIPGEYVLGTDPVTCNAGKDARILDVVNRGDRPVQVGSHYHFAEVNPQLKFDRPAARGMRLDSPAGTAVRFEPGDARSVHLVPLGGAREVYGLRDEENGSVEPAAGGTRQADVVEVPETVEGDREATSSPVKNSTVSDEEFRAGEEQQTSSMISGSRASGGRASAGPPESASESEEDRS